MESPPPPPLEKPPIDETTDSTVASEPKKKTPPSKPIRRSSQRSLASNSPKSEQHKDGENSSVSSKNKFERILNFKKLTHCDRPNGHFEDSFDISYLLEKPEMDG